MTIKSNINWYKFLSEAANKKSLKEITQHVLNQTKMENYLSGKKSSQLDDVFDGKNRFAIPLESETTSNPRDTEMLGYINQLRKSGWTIDFSEPFGYAFKIVTSEHDGKTYKTKRKMKIGPLISAISPEAAEFWTKNNKFYTTKENELYFATKYMIVISRVPIDILRMSDHDKWSSCHSPGNGYFKCAIEESVTGGAIAYVVSKEDLDKVDLSAPEVFSDKHRKIDGISPLSRLRIRRFVGSSLYRGLELGVPEERYYGQDFPGFYQALVRYLLDSQKTTIEQIKKISKESGRDVVDLYNWNLTGGSYLDTDGRRLFEEFFVYELVFSGYTGKEPSFIEQEQLEQRIDQKVQINNEILKHCSIYADIEFTGGEPEDYYINCGGDITIEIEGEINFKASRTVRADLIERLRNSFEIINGDEIKTVIENGKTKFSFQLYDEDLSIEEDFDNFVWNVTNLDNRIDEVEDVWIEILMEEGYISNPFYQFEEVFENQIQNFTLDLDSSGAYASNRRDKTSEIKINTAQFIENIEGTLDTNLAERYTKDFYQLVHDKWAERYSSKYSTGVQEVHNNIINNFINRLKLDINKQQSLFEAEIKNLKKPSSIVKQKQTPITDKTLDDLGIGFEFRNYINYFPEKNIVLFQINISFYNKIQKGKATDQTSADIFLKLAKYLDKNYSKIIQFYREKAVQIIQESYEQIIEMIKQKQPPKEYKKYSGSQFNQQRLSYPTNTSGWTRTEYIEEKKNKIFKLDGATWRIIND